MKVGSIALNMSLAGLLSVGALRLATMPIASSAPEVSPTAESVTPETVIDEAVGAQRLRLTLTLSAPEDLKVRQGDSVTQGQILSDRTRDRQRLDAQKQQLQIQIDRLKQPIPGPPPQQSIPQVAGLPVASFLDEVAAVEQAKLKVEAADRNVMQQQRMIDLLQSMPDAQLPESTIPHEEEVLAQLQQQADQARADQDLAEAKLQQAQSDRQYQEYLHSLEMSKRALQIQQQELERQNQLQQQQAEERNRSYQLAELEARMQQLDAQIISLASVRSPFNGTIQRIKWQGQNDQNLVVELVLMANSPGSSASSPGAIPDGSGNDSGGDDGTTSRGDGG